ncbi:MAG: hypothetical protein ACJ8R9_17870 [Steroidobacteraceae bacterium]
MRLLYLRLAFCLLAPLLLASASGARGAVDRVPTLLKQLCAHDDRAIESVAAYKSFLERIVAFLTIAPHLPAFPTDCLLRLPEIAKLKLRNIEDWKSGGYGNRNEVIGDITWYYASYLLSSSNNEAYRNGLDDQLARALTGPYTNEPGMKACVQAQYEFAKQYTNYLTGAPDRAAGLAAFQQFRSVIHPEATCALPGFHADLVPPFFDSGTAWGRELLFDDLLTRSNSDRPQLTELYFGVDTSSWDDKRRFIQRRMLSEPLLVPTGLTRTFSGPADLRTTVHLTAHLTAGDAGTKQVDEDLGPSVRNHWERNDWYNRDYGEVYSQSDVYIHHADKVDVGPDMSYGVSVASFVQGGYDPPFPGKTIHTRGAHNYKSFVNFDLSVRVDIPGCDPNDASCFPSATVTAAVSKDDTGKRITNSIQLIQNQTALVGQDKDLGERQFVLNRSLGPVHVQLDLRRDDFHEGAQDAFPWQEQAGAIFIDLDNARDPRMFDGKGYRTAVDSYLRHYDDSVSLGPYSAASLGPALSYFPMRAAGDDESDVVRANNKYDIYLRLFWASKILEVDSTALSLADKQGIEKSQRILSALVRDLYLNELRRRITELKTLAADVNTQDLDFALASILEGLPSKTALAIDRLATFQETNLKTLTLEQRALVRSVIASSNAANRATAREPSISVEAAMDIVKLKSSISHLRNVLHDELFGDVVELARLEDDCARVLAEYSKIIETDLTHSHLFNCPNGSHVATKQ